MSRGEIFPLYPSVSRLCGSQLDHTQHAPPPEDRFLPESFREGVTIGNGLKPPVFAGSACHGKRGVLVLRGGKLSEEAPQETRGMFRPVRWKESSENDFLMARSTS